MDVKKSFSQKNFLANSTVIKVQKLCQSTIPFMRFAKHLYGFIKI